VCAESLRANRRFQEKIDLVDSLQAEVNRLMISSDKQCAELSELRGRLTSKEKNLKHADVHIEELSSTLELALADNKVIFIGSDYSAYRKAGVFDLHGFLS
jgi:chromosome segregation ATPase